jgi:uncharacterized repeat protein (TIGR03806 family)
MSGAKTDRRSGPVSSTGLLCFLMLLIAGCRSHREAPEVLDLTADPPEKLSAYGLFHGNGSTQEPADGVVPYDLNSPLFSDYAAKYRFVRLPPGTSAVYRDEDVFEFPVGTIIVKTFAYPHDMRDLSKGQRLLETRLLIHQPDGWTGLPYVWNDEQSEATLKVAGGACDVHWVHSDGKERTVNYLIPNTNQCLGCHENSKVMAPIGPKARNLNKSFPYPEGSDNQLAHWGKVGYLRGAPSPAQAPRLPVWDDPSTGTVEQRARAWLEINCAHCHNPKGPARTSGLDLMASQTDRYKQGIWKTPIAAGRGSGGRFYDIIPGKPDASILVYRIESTELGVMMPELSRRLVHEEGVALVRQWIAGMKENRVQ